MCYYQGEILQLVMHKSIASWIDTRRKKANKDLLTNPN